MDIRGGERTAEVHVGVVLGRGGLQEEGVQLPHRLNLVGRVVDFDAHHPHGDLVPLLVRQQRAADARASAVAGHHQTALADGAVVESDCHGPIRAGLHIVRCFLPLGGAEGEKPWSAWPEAGGGSQTTGGATTCLDIKPRRQYPPQPVPRHADPLRLGRRRGLGPELAGAEVVERECGRTALLDGGTVDVGLGQAADQVLGQQGPQRRERPVQRQPPAKPARGQVGVPLEDAERCAGLAQVLRQQQAADAGADDQDRLLLGSSSHVLRCLRFWRLLSCPSNSNVAHSNSALSAIGGRRSADLTLPKTAQCRFPHERLACCPSSPPRTERSSLDSRLVPSEDVPVLHEYEDTYRVVSVIRTGRDLFLGDVRLNS
ncbi:da1fa013-8b84-4bc7-96e5-9c1922336aba [Thermothielavioides terrestris]|uniref:Da1fa013-8b84-4bc7-96e5-9c1922336aba n=1 Tax=Thermothielavioides terrestris TaxID=2587410 RepID=A0A3S4AYE4_9PEZI|nr:da1fa013-8b84-4bc7-96e5-9c1922336aba [Thermothielavioides terrestris]